MSTGYDSQPTTPTPAGRGRPKGAGTGAKRGRKPKGAPAANSSVNAGASPRPFITTSFSPTSPAAPSPSFTTSGHQGQNGEGSRVHWGAPGAEGITGPSSAVGNSSNADSATAGSATQAGPVIDPALVALGAAPPAPGTPKLEGLASLSLTGRGSSHPPPGLARPGGEEEGEVDDEALPAMADDDYSAQLSWQSQSKDNLKVLMDNLSPAQYDRFEAYRRHALPKQAVRKVIQQTLGHQVSQPVAQIIAGFSKVFVGEMVEKARAVQARRGEVGPLSPDHLREAYRAYQGESGRVGAARPLRSKKLFVR
ncbi:hTAFII28-like protein conserved region-domain-containing protein [Crepidotus variabilis]|uniref:Transcription initiation factor TFIID subunit 11 n=1 Tax=Crepidotus variabilis TaxID=179855 RepID=A0A9P6E834_9AGAR|nr:hTAFII28-like protein conserved region-domain-containing protein [Crepidotus variabilis]